MEKLDFNKALQLSDPFSDVLHKEEQDLQAQLDKWLGQEEEQYRQKRRKLWLQCGDRNTKFFHSSITIRQNRNFIRHLYTDSGACATDVEQLRIMAPEYFFKLFNQNSYINVFPKLIVGKHLTVDAQSWLTRSVTMEEIKTVVFKMHPDKSPGPDVFNPDFYQRNWEVITPDLCKAVLFFFQNGRLLKEVKPYVCFLNT